MSEPRGRRDAPHVLVLVPDLEIRTIKVCEVLDGLGARVTLATERHRFDTWNSRLRALSGTRFEVVSHPRLPTQLAWNPVRAAALRRLAVPPVDLVYARDIFLGEVALGVADALAARGGARPPVVVDVADDYVSVLRETPSRLRRAYSRVFDPRRVEGRVLRGADRLWFVVPAAVPHYERRHGVSLDGRASVVRNVPNGPLSAAPPPPPAGRAGEALYVGTIDRGIRDFEVVLAADAHLTRPVTMDCYVLSLNRNAYVRELAARAAGLRHLRLRFLDPVPTDRYAALLDGYRVGVIPHRRNDICDYTVPNKLYDYLDRGLTVLASDNPSNVSELEGEPGGFLYRGEDPRDFAAQLERALDHAASGASVPAPRGAGFYFPAALRAALDGLAGVGGAGAAPARRAAVPHTR